MPANVRDMARKFEGLFKELHINSVDRKDSTSREAERMLAYRQRHKKPTKSHSERGSSSSTGTTTADDDDNDDDDLLFDKLITDVNIVVNQSTPSSMLLFGSSVDEKVSVSLESPETTIVLDSIGHRVIEELLTVERSYLRNLTDGITNYMMAPYAHDRPGSADLAHIFANIIVIRNFHENTFLPALESNANDVEQLCNCFCQFIDAGYFYSYIEYAINRKRAKALCDQNQTYFRRRAAEVGDRLGLESAFLMMPIQRLPRYQLLLFELIKQLGVWLSSDEHDGITAKIAACCRAEKCIQRLLDRMNDSMMISDIVEFQSVSRTEEKYKQIAPKMSPNGAREQRHIVC